MFAAPGDCFSEGLALLIYRLLAAALLVFVGTFFLVYTVSVTELLLGENDVDVIVYSTLLYSTLLYSILFYSTLLYSILFYSVLV